MTEQDTLKQQLKEIYEWYKDAYREPKFNKVEKIYNELKKGMNNDEKIINLVCENSNCKPYLKATVIDACYSTQVRRFSKLSEICKCLETEEYPAPKDCNEEQINKIIEEIRENKEIDKFPFSFLTKYFALHDRKKFPIYDKYVQMYIDAFGETFNKNKNTYYEFYKIMDRLKGNLDFEKLDNKIWYTAKLIQEIFRNEPKYENKDDIINNLINELQMSDNDAKFFTELLKTHIKGVSKKKNKSQDNS